MEALEDGGLLSKNKMLAGDIPVLESEHGADVGLDDDGTGSE